MQGCTPLMDLSNEMQGKKPREINRRKKEKKNKKPKKNKRK